MARIQQITPMMPVTDVADAVGFFERTLGFRAIVSTHRHAYLERGSGAIRLNRAAPDMDMNDPKRQQTVYVDVDDVDALFAEHRAELEKLPTGLVRAPFNQDYNQREFHVIYESILIFFGQPITAETST